MGKDARGGADQYLYLNLGGADPGHSAISKSSVRLPPISRHVPAHARARARTRTPPARVAPTSLWTRWRNLHGHPGRSADEGLCGHI